MFQAEILLRKTKLTNCSQEMSRETEILNLTDKSFPPGKKIGIPAFILEPVLIVLFSFILRFKCKRQLIFTKPACFDNVVFEVFSKISQTTSIHVK